MNKRLLDLYKTAVPSAIGINVKKTKSLHCTPEQLEDFANLIVLECIDICNQYSRDTLKYSQFGAAGAVDCAAMIREKLLQKD